MDKKKFYYIGWRKAERVGNIKYAGSCKEAYRKLVMAELIKPLIYLN